MVKIELQLLSLYKHAFSKRNGNGCMSNKTRLFVENQVIPLRKISYVKRPNK